jgi:type I restriction enzyme S subunit
MINRQKLPHGWSEKTVGDLFKLESGSAPVKFRPGDFSGPILVLGANGPIGSCDEANYGPGYLVGRVGAVGVVTKVEVPVWASDNTLTATPKPDICSQSFGGHYLHFLSPSKLATMTAQPLITQTNLSKLRAPVPEDLCEQAYIAAVLDTIDEAIAKTEAVIAKLRQIRDGLLHDLLTRGLDENGEIRDPIFNPNQFKDSPLGKIPNGWEAKGIKDCYLIPSRNGLYKKVSSYGFGHRMIHMPQMFKSTIVETNEAVRVEVTPAELQRYALEEGDLLFARRSLNLEGAGLCSIIPELKEPVTFESSIIRVRLDRRKILPHFAVEFLRSPKGYLLRRPFIRQVAVSGVSSEDVGQFLLPCPEPSEQERILSVLEIYDQALSLFEKKLVKLNSIKEGLMSDLLIGRVRVPEGII